MIKYSVILPCYNEAENLLRILELYKAILLPEDSELIIVNNGSTDNTAKFLEENILNYSFARFITVPINKGYGYGIIQGLKESKGVWIGWSHADLQTDPSDVARAINICEGKTKDELIYVKGKRLGRKWNDRIFSRGLEFFVRIVLRSKLYEINAQPNFFNRKLFEKAKFTPDHWGLDLYFYYLAVNSGYNFERISVSFHKRISGKSKWNTGIFSKFVFSFKMLKYCFEIRKNENNKS